MIPDSWFPYVVAPMVDQSELAYRLLCRKYGATLCYTPMFYSKRFCDEPEYRKFCLETVCEMDRPLIVQFCANDPQVLLEAAKYVESYCDAVDINLGCPQRRAREGHFGASLLQKKDWELVNSMVSILNQNLSIPVTCKIRLFGKIEESIEFAKGLESSGCQMLAIHGRFPSETRRRHGKADLDAVRKIREQLKIPVISNGNVRCFQDIHDNLKLTGAKGVMSAEAILENPTLFSNLEFSDQHKLNVTLEYLDLCLQFPPPIKWIVMHVNYILENLLNRQFDLNEKLKVLETLSEVRQLVLDLKDRVEKKIFFHREKGMNQISNEEGLLNELFDVNLEM